MNDVSVVSGVQPLSKESRTRRSFLPALRRWLREPLLHFLLLGILLFAIYGYMHRGRFGVESSRQIALTLDDLRTMDAYVESQ